MNNTMYRIISGLLALLTLLTVMSNVKAETVTYYFNDLSGSPVAAIDSSGNRIWRESYQPFGEKRVKPSASNNDIGYTGHQNDDFIGLTYMQARYYDSTLGRFYGIDPVPYTEKNPVQSFNPYLYGNNSPYNYTDPDGRAAVLACLAPGVNIACAALAEATISGTVATISFIGGWFIAEAVDDALEDSSDSPDSNNGKSEVDGFVDDMKGRSESDSSSGKSKVRTITDGTTVDEAFDDFPGKEGEASDGSPIKTASDGSTAHTHSSSTDNGKKTLTIKRPKSKKPIKFREPEIKND